MSSLATRALAGFLALQSPIFTETTAVDPTTGTGLQRPVGWRVLSSDGTNAWDKTGTGATAWSVIGTGVGGVSTFNGSAGSVLFHPSSSIASCTALAALTSTAAAGYFDGCTIYVVSVDAVFKMQTSALATNPVDVINASGFAGHQWIRQRARSAFWESQATWHINSGGSDDSSTTTVATAAELRRRLYGCSVSTTVNVDNDMATGDAMIFDPTISGQISVVGTLNVTSTLAVASAAARNPATNQLNEITCTGHDFTGDVGSLLRQQGTSNYAPIQKAVSLGVARLGQLVTTSGTVASSTGIGAGVNVEIVNFTRGPTNVRALGSLNLVLSFMKWTAGLSLRLGSQAAASVFGACTITGTFTCSSIGASVTMGCTALNGALTSGASSWGVSYAGCGFLGVGAVGFQGGTTIVSACTFQGKGFNVADGCYVEVKGDIPFSDLPAAAIAIQLQKNSRCTINDVGAVFGGGNDVASIACNLSLLSQIYYGNKANWTLTTGIGFQNAAGNTAIGSLPLALNASDGTAAFGT